MTCSDTASCLVVRYSQSGLCRQQPCACTLAHTLLISIWPDDFSLGEKREHFPHKCYKNNIDHLILLNFIKVILNCTWKVKVEIKEHMAHILIPFLWILTNCLTLTSKGTNGALASESIAGKSSLTGSTIQTRAATTGVLLKWNILTLILIPTLVMPVLIIITVILLAITRNYDNDNANDFKNEDIMMA